MPDIPSKEKHLIRIIANKYSKIISRLKFCNGSLIYQRTYEYLYKKSSRWKFCLLCGKIATVDSFTHDEHTCPPFLFQQHPICCSTSWIKLRDFFLSDKYLETLSEVGVEVITGS